ncbi:hypothetical protein GCM10010921_26840 [Microbacterium album]|uniref:Rhamnosyl transferase n=1 Tax=Microbacterium album TaxID=2053191 RepID=A0A917IHG4_9MICO|nr:hypothetical protein GCM10010921_26840 [Microbacterium album]
MGATDLERRPRAAPAPTRRVDHVLLTRFNLPSVGRESVIRAQDGWLRERLELFLRYTVPAVASQTAPVGWIVYLDPASPAWLLERLAPLVTAGAFAPLYRETVSREEIAEDARAVTGGSGDVLLTTNLDNDDALATDFAARLQALARPGERRALYLAHGLIRRGGHVYLRRDRRNAFVSVSEPWDEPMTAWRDWHNLMHRHMPVLVDGGAPAWIQVVHDRNVSNRVRGRRIDPGRHRALFPGMLDDAAPTGPGAILVDGWLRRPLRESREGVRVLGKRVVLAAAGKRGLDALKDRLYHRPPAALQMGGRPPGGGRDGNAS